MLLKSPSPQPSTSSEPGTRKGPSPFLILNLHLCLFHFFPPPPLFFPLLSDPLSLSPTLPPFPLLLSPINAIKLMILNKKPRAVNQICYAFFCTRQGHHPFYTIGKKSKCKDIFVKSWICVLWVLSAETSDGILMGATKLWSVAETIPETPSESGERKTNRWTNWLAGGQSDREW